MTTDIPAVARGEAIKACAAIIVPICSALREAESVGTGHGVSASEPRTKAIVNVARAIARMKSCLHFWNSNPRFRSL